MSDLSISFDDFDPNNLKSKTSIWGVFGNGCFNLTGYRAGALNKFRALSMAKLYRYETETNTWKLIAVKDEIEKHIHCDLCGKSTLTTRCPKPYQYNNYYIKSHGQWNLIRYGWMRINGKIPADNPEFHYVCDECADTYDVR